MEIIYMYMYASLYKEKIILIQTYNVGGNVKFSSFLE